MNRFSLGLGLIAAAVLAGCSGGSDANQGDLVSVGSSLVGAVRATAAKPDQTRGRVTVTRKLLDETPGEVLQVVPDSTGLQDFLFLVGRRTDDTPGQIEVWKSTDNAQLILRDGVLVGSKGLGGDIRSAQAQTTLAGFDGVGGGGERLFTVARLDGTADAIAFSCDVDQLGREVIQIVDQRVSTYHLRETCQHGQTRFTNEYWVETNGGRMRRSRQWGGPVFGYMSIERLKN